MSALVLVSGGIVTSLVLLKIYNTRRVGKCTSHAKLTGKTAIVTGANTGIGYSTAVDLAKRGARVILACRDQRKADMAREKIVRESGNQDVHVRILDLASFHSVRDFADVIKRDCKCVNILVNNAGGTGFPDVKTDDGVHIMLQINYFGPFLLTNLLLDILTASKARIVNITSGAYKFGAVDLDFFRDSRPGLITKGRLYCHAKLATMLSSLELSRRLEGSGTTVNCVVPGFVKTELFRDMSTSKQILLFILGSMFSVIKTPQEGAQTTIHCAVSETMEGVSGQVYEDCRPHRPSGKACDSDKAEKLWLVTEKVTGLAD